MPGHINVGGTWKELNGLHVKVSGAWKAVHEGFVKVGGVWKQFYLFYSASGDKSAVSGSDSGFSACGNPGGTDSVTITPVGGASPYTYAWALVSAPATRGPYTPTNPTGAVCAWTDPSVCDADAQSTETWRCTVTDDAANEVTVDVDVSLIWIDLN